MSPITATSVIWRLIGLKQSRTTLADRCRKAIAGAKKYLASVTITLDGVDYTSDALAKLFQSFVDQYDAAVAAKAKWAVAAQNELAMHATVVALLAALRAYVLLKFGQKAVDTLAEFGFSPRKKVVKTTETKADAVKKARATRVARHTMGSVQEKAVHGVLPSTEPVSPAGTTTQPTPAVTPQAPVAPKS